VREFQLGTLGVSPVEPDLIIAPNTEKQVISRYQVPETISLLTINPHMHMLGKSFKAYALPPNGGDTIRLISIPRWDFNWQYFYTFEKMVKIPAGSWIIAEGVYDNTRLNRSEERRVGKERRSAGRASPQTENTVATETDARRT